MANALSPSSSHCLLFPSLSNEALGNHRNVGVGGRNFFWTGVGVGWGGVGWGTEMHDDVVRGKTKSARPVSTILLLLSDTTDRFFNI